MSRVCGRVRNTEKCGENDTAILGADATMEDNVSLLRRVLKTQNQLIRETINENLDEVPRMMVLFTEVEGFFYGDEKTKGLLDEPELEGVTLMLSDNNQGAARTLPTKAMRNHKGGYGMYYHMDMHGGPMAFFMALVYPNILDSVMKTGTMKTASIRSALMLILRMSRG